MDGIYLPTLHKLGTNRWDDVCVSYTCIKVYIIEWEMEECHHGELLVCEIACCGVH